MPPSPLTSPALPIGRRQITPSDRRRPWTIIASVLLHLVALAFLLTARRAEPPTPVAPSYDLVFENGGSSAAPKAPDQAPDTPSEAPAADLPPTPLSEPPAPPTPTESRVPEPPPVSLPGLEPIPTPESPPDPDSVKPPSEPEPPPIEAAPTPEPPAVRLAEPGPTPNPLSPEALVPDLPTLAPPPSPPEPPRPRQQAQQRPPPGAFPPPIDLNFGPTVSRAPTPRIARSSRAIDLSLGAPKPAPDKNEPYFNIRSANVGADWMQTVRKHLSLHAYYPRQAVENNEQGVVGLEFVVNRQGRVTSVEITSRSGSPWLDMAMLSTFRNAQLAPLPFEDTNSTATVQVTMTYVLVR